MRPESEERRAAAVHRGCNLLDSSQRARVAAFDCTYKSLRLIGNKLVPIMRNRERRGRFAGLGNSDSLRYSTPTPSRMPR
jgi:hypothetical protein